MKYKINADKTINPAAWYTEVCLKSHLTMHGLTKGTMAFLPYGYAIWLNFQKLLNAKFNELSVQQVQLPMFLPSDLINKEKEHFEGFKSELGFINQVGDKTLEIPLAIRPTSEILFCHVFGKNLVNYKQLPIKYSQWCNVVRWEKNTKLFMRNIEFLWQEGHTICNTNEDNQSEIKKYFQIYSDFIENKLLLATFKGEKTLAETFAGAKKTYTVETILQDGQALQLATVHDLKQKFTKAFDVTYTNNKNEIAYPYQSSYGISTRTIGAIISSHSDEKGLILPSAIAPYLVAIVPIAFRSEQKLKIIDYIKKLTISKLDYVKIIDEDDSFSNLNQKCQLQGVPVVINIGERNITSDNFDYRIRTSSSFIKHPLTDLTDKFLLNLIKKNDTNIKNKHREMVDLKHMLVTNYLDIAKLVKKQNFGQVFACNTCDFEEKIKNQYQITVRCILKQAKSGVCINCQKMTKTAFIIARTY